MSRPGRSRLTALVVVAALIAGGCSDDDGDDASSTSNSSTSTSTSTSVVADPSTSSPDEGEGGGTTETTGDDRPSQASEADMERAESVNLTIEDFPSGWQNLPPSEAEVSVVDLCSTVDLEAHRLAQVRSDAFSYSIEPGTLQASTAAVVADTEEAAADLVDDFRDDSFVKCASDNLSRDTDTYTVTGSLARNDTEPDIGDEAVALSGDFVVEPSDGSPEHTISAVVVAIRKGTTVVTFNTTATDRGLEEQVIRDLLTRIDERLG